MADQVDATARAASRSRASDERFLAAVPRGQARNLSAVLRLLHTEGPMTRAALTRALDVNRSTMLHLVGTLTDRGFVTEIEGLGGPARTGRPSLLVSLNVRRVVAAAASIRHDAITTALVGLGGVVLSQHTRRLPVAATEPREVARIVATALRAELASASSAESLVVGIGVAVPGSVRPSDGGVERAANLLWDDVPLGDWLREDLGEELPIIIDNDACLGALGEHLRGVGRNAEHLVYVLGDIGIGGGVIHDGQLLRGASGSMAEIGHLPLAYPGKLCRCGARGCWETLVGAEAILEAAGRTGSHRHEVAAVVTAAMRGDRTAAAALEETEAWLAVGVRALASLYNPQMIVFAGYLEDVVDHLGDELALVVRRNMLPSAAAVLSITTGSLGDNAVLIGAAERTLLQAVEQLDLVS
ncbi:ROK family transcriptional regulator [Acidothermaceae bacterium B102]|nr:ROK family transcriptional regulator [Acidothermaceae bacterium B102]